MGDNTGCGAVMVQPNRFQRVAVGISIGLPSTDISPSPYVYSIRTFPKFDLRRTFLDVVIAYTGGSACTIHHADTDRCSLSGRWQFRYNTLLSLCAALGIYRLHKAMRSILLDKDKQ